MFVMGLFWVTVAVSFIWYFTAFFFPGFVRKLSKSENTLLFNICVGISGFLILPAFVSVWFLVEYYLITR